ncbi:hypothetical protein ENBRE01_2908 [Enteropsectra breve]|nr:hypothetical protein ENBRE01_2908 [Enteropsectra breve]
MPIYYNSLEEIGGKDMIIKIDESKFGKKYHNGHHVEGVWVLEMVEETGAKRIKLVVVKNRNANTLKSEISYVKDAKSTIYSDC